MRDMTVMAARAFGKSGEPKEAVSSAIALDERRHALW
jgi:hypothetical protein